MTAEAPIPRLSLWSATELNAAIASGARFVVPSGLGGAFYARLTGFDRETGRFQIDHVQAGDFHDKPFAAPLSVVDRIAGPCPEIPAARARAEAETIAAQNDRFRRGCGSPVPGVVGQWVVTPGVNAMGAAFVRAAVEAVATFDRFEPHDDPHGERDFGAFTIEGERLFWKIDLYDEAYAFGSPAPAEPARTRRVLTVLLADEY